MRDAARILDRQIPDRELQPRRAWPRPSRRAAARGGRPSARRAPRAWSSAVSRVATISPRRMTETASVIAMISRSLWVMRMIVLPCVLELLEDAEEMVGLGRRQHAGRLVEDQDVGAAIERLQDLDALLQADRQLVDDRVGIDLQPVFALQPLAARRAPWRCSPSSSASPSAPSMTFSSTVKGSTSMKCWWTMPMPSAMASLGVLIDDRLAVDADLAAVGLVEAVEDRHQRRLAGAVLADDAVDRAALRRRD